MSKGKLFKLLTSASSNKQPNKQETLAKPNQKNDAAALKRKLSEEDQVREAKRQKKAEKRKQKRLAATQGTTTAGTQQFWHRQKQQHQQRQQQQQEAEDDDLVDKKQLLGEGSAYDAFVALLASRKSKHTQSLRLLQQEQAGDSEGSESEGGEGESDEGEGEDEDEDLSDMSDEGDMDGGADDDQQGVLNGRAAQKTKTAAASSKQSSKSAELGEGEGSDGSVSDEDESLDDDRLSHSDEHDDGDDGQGLNGNHTTGNSIDAAGHGPSTQPDHADDSSAAAADTWHRHVSKELSDAEVAALQDAKVAFKDAPAHPDHSASWKGEHWQLHGRSELPPAPASLAEAGVKERLQARWREVHQEDAQATADRQDGTATASTSGAEFVSPQQRSFFGILSSYMDVLHTCKPYPMDSLDPPDADLDAILLHCLNHVAKIADRIKKNNDRLSSGGLEDTPRDQGFTRPKVLLLFPQRNFAFKAIRRLCALAIKETRADSIQGKEKLVEQFTEPDEDQEEERKVPKPSDHKAIFSGNMDDHFRLGIKLTRGAVRLFSDLLQSDIIVASPIALATKIAEDAKDGSAADFLSSIEILVFERTDMMCMQNWEHVETVMSHLNKLPKEQHGTDIMRVREWYLSGQARHYRQTIITTSFPSVDINALFNSSCSNYEGKARLKATCPGVLAQILSQVQQLFERFTAPSAADVSDARFRAFQQLVWSKLKESSNSGLMIFVPSYFDYVRLRNFLMQEDAEFVSVTEYSSGGDVTRSRSRFFHRQRRILLYTERAHFFFRRRVRGVKDILFYGLPQHAHFYAEVVNLLEAADGPAGVHSTVTVLFNKYDALELERVVGSSRAKKMLSAATGTFMFC